MLRNVAVTGLCVHSPFESLTRILQGFHCLTKENKYYLHSGSEAVLINDSDSDVIRRIRPRIFGPRPEYK